MPLGMGLGGVLGDLTGQNAEAVFVGCGLVSALSTILLAIDPAYWAFFDEVESRMSEDTVEVR